MRDSRQHEKLSHHSRHTNLRLWTRLIAHQPQYRKHCIRSYTLTLNSTPNKKNTEIQLDTLTPRCILPPTSTILFPFTETSTYENRPVSLFTTDLSTPSAIKYPNDDPILRYSEPKQPMTINYTRKQPPFQKSFSCDLPHNAVNLSTY